MPKEINEWDKVGKVSNKIESTENVAVPEELTKEEFEELVKLFKSNFWNIDHLFASSINNLEELKKKIKDSHLHGDSLSRRPTISNNIRGNIRYFFQSDSFKNLLLTLTDFNSFLIGEFVDFDSLVQVNKMLIFENDLEYSGYKGMRGLIPELGRIRTIFSDKSNWEYHLGYTSDIDKMINVVVDSLKREMIQAMLFFRKEILGLIAKNTGIHVEKRSIFEMAFGLLKHKSKPDFKYPSKLKKKQLIHYKVPT